MAFLYRYSIRHPVSVIVVAIVAVAAVAPGVLRLQLRTDGHALVPTGAPEIQIDRSIRDAYDNEDPTYFGTITDPTLPDGKDLAIPKIKDGTTVRNATGPEILTFATAKSTDQTLIDRASAKDTYDLDPVAKKYLKAIVELMLDEINTLRALHSLSDRTLAQAKTAIDNKIDSGNFD